MKLQGIRIQNFKSFKDTKLNLGDIHLLIGANSSGKTNFLKALTFFKNLIEPNRKNLDYFYELFKSISFNKGGISQSNPFALTFVFKNLKEKKYSSIRIEMYNANRNEFAILCGISDDLDLDFNLTNLNKIDSLFNQYRIYASGNAYKKVLENTIKNKTLLTTIEQAFKSAQNIDFYINKATNEYTKLSPAYDLNGFIHDIDRFEGFHGFGDFLRKFIYNIKIYKPDPNRIIEPYPLNGEDSVNEDASNLVSFFDKMKDLNIEVMNRINQDLNKCIKEFKDIRLDTIKQSEGIYSTLHNYYQRDTFKKIGVSDVNKNIFWAEELSEGTLYFIALLAIMHQPNPPQILLLEEPEKGIHPRRIQEVIIFLEELCVEKNIQIILTTHSPIVVDQFSNDTSKIFAFDKVNGETKISNLKNDIIDPKNKILQKRKIKSINYEESLSENWLMGLLNGVPND